MSNHYTDLFCRIYDTYGWNYYPETFAELLQIWIKQEKMEVKSLLDLGCGTGILCGCMEQAGVHCKGVDLSESMIAIAREHYPEVEFEQGDLLALKMTERYDLITATLDVMNHFLTEDDLQQVFFRVISCLEEHGTFLFDLLREEDVFSFPWTDLGETEDGTRLYYQVQRRENGIVELSTRSEKDGRISPEELVLERIYDPAIVTEMLRKAGFTHIVVRDKLMENMEGKGTAWFFFARKD